jgi:hypothetical protein
MNSQSEALLCLDRLYATLKKDYGGATLLASGNPRFLFRGEQRDWPDSLSSLDRYWHGAAAEETHDELDRITALPLPWASRFLTSN